MATPLPTASCLLTAWDSMEDCDRTTAFGGGQRDGALSTLAGLRLPRGRKQGTPDLQEGVWLCVDLCLSAHLAAPALGPLPPSSPLPAEEGPKCRPLMGLVGTGRAPEQATGFLSPGDFSQFSLIKSSAGVVLFLFWHWFMCRQLVAPVLGHPEGMAKPLAVVVEPVWGCGVQRRLEGERVGPPQHRRD